MLKAVIFDLDGTIIDSEPLHSEAVLRIFREHSITLAKGDLDRYIGISNTVMWREMRRDHGLIESIEDLKAQQYKLNLELLNAAGSILMPGVPELLENLRSHGIAMAIASSSAREYITTVVAEYGLDGYFSHLVSGEEVPRGKPRPDIFLKAAELLGTSPSDCVVIEDSDNGLNAAREAGIRAVGIQNSNSGNQSLALADRVVKSIPEITIELLNKLVDPTPAA